MPEAVPRPGKPQEHMTPLLAALFTPREDLLPPPPKDGPLFSFKPQRIGADSAQAGPNGIISGCTLAKGTYTVGMCSVHIGRAILTNKHQYFKKKGKKDKDGKRELIYPPVRHFNSFILQ